MKNYIKISPQEVEEAAEIYATKNHPRLCQPLFNDMEFKAFLSGAEFVTTKANAQLTPILDEAVRVMDDQMRFFIIMEGYATLQDSFMYQKRITDLEKAIKNINDLKG